MYAWMRSALLLTILVAANFQQSAAQSRKKCDVPPPPDSTCTANLINVQSKYKANKDSAEYQCIDGYKVKGGTNADTTATMACTDADEDGGWDLPPPSCEPMTCVKPAKGKKTVKVAIADDELSVGDTYTYSCLPGYSTTDSLDTVCQDPNTWSNPGPQCEINTCTPLPDGVNTKSPPESLDALTSYMYTCKNGFYPDGNLFYVCSADGILEPSDAPSCKKVTCSPIPAGTGTKPVSVASLEAPDSYQYECLDGYTTEDPLCTVCQPDGTLSNPPPTCEIKECPIPPPGKNTVPAEQKFSSLEVYTYTCLPGHVTTDEVCSVCLPSGEWSLETPPDCEPVECEAPPDGVNTEKVDPSLVLLFTQYYKYECLEGFTTTDEVVTICQEDGTLSLDMAPNCTVVTCDPPLPGVETKPVPNELFVYQEMYMYECKDGFTTTDNLITECLADGSWSVPPPTCREGANKCPLPPNGCLTKPVPGDTPTEIGDEYEYECLDGFIKNPFESTLTSTCQDDGTWSLDPPPSCTEECEFVPGLFMGVIPKTQCGSFYIISGGGNVEPTEFNCDSGEFFSITDCQCTTKRECCQVN